MKIETQNLTEFMQSYQQRVESYLENHLPNKNSSPQQLHQAMHYAVMGNGKRLRPLLVYATGIGFGVDAEMLDTAAAAVELIHCYSLVHDDLPCMDNDNMRRGKPSCHKAFDESIALLVGDALQSLAFKLLAEPTINLSATAQINMVETLAFASGSLGMAGGQAVDLQTTHEILHLESLETMHSLKTGALIRASVRLAALAVPTIAAETFIQLDQFARAIGLAFQIQDDILDDSPTLTPLETRKQRVQELYQIGLQALQHFPQTQLLQQLSAKLVARSS